MKIVTVFGEKARLENMRWTCRVQEIADILNKSRNAVPMTSLEEGERAELWRVKILFGAE